MASYTLSPIFDPQYVATGAAALQFAVGSSAASVPTGFNYMISVFRVSNPTANGVTLQIWRVPAGEAADGQHIIIPQFTVPAGTEQDLTALWGDVLQPGDAIWALAGTADALVVHGDGVVITL